MTNQNYAHTHDLDAFKKNNSWVTSKLTSKSVSFWRVVEAETDPDEAEKELGGKRRRGLVERVNTLSIS